MALNTSRALVGWLMAGAVLCTPAPAAAQFNLNVAVCNLTIRASWDHPPGGPVPYELKVTADSSGQIVLFTVQVGTVNTVTGGLPVNGTYWIFVRAVGGPWFGPAFVDTTRVDPIWTPGTPTLRVEVNPIGGVAFLWQAPTTGGPIESYIIDVRTAAGAPVGAVNVGNRLVFETNALPDGEYDANVRVQNSCTTGAPSNTVRFRVSRAGGPCDPPTVVRNLRANLTGRTVTVQWDPPVGGSAVVNYQVSAGTAPGAEDLANDIPIQGTSVMATLPSGRYYVRVKAVSACGSVSEEVEIMFDVP